MIEFLTKNWMWVLIGIVVIGVGTYMWNGTA